MPARALLTSSGRLTLPVLAGATLTCACALLPVAVHADSSVVSDTLEDVKLYFTAPIRWDGEDWLAVAGSLAAGGVAQEGHRCGEGERATGSKIALDASRS